MEITCSWPDLLALSIGASAGPALSGDDQCGGSVPHRDRGVSGRHARPDQAGRLQQHGSRQDGAHALPGFHAPAAGAPCACDVLEGCLQQYHGAMWMYNSALEIICCGNIGDIPICDLGRGFTNM